MNDNLIVLVGSGVLTNDPCGQEILAAAIEERGFKVERVFNEHPRDQYVEFNGRYFRKEDYGKHAEGRMIQSGLDYLLVSENAFVVSDLFSLEDATTETLNREAYREWTKQKMEKLYGTRVHVIPSQPFRPQGTDGHLDYSVFLSPLSKLLVQDVGSKRKTDVSNASVIEKLHLISHIDTFYPHYGVPVNAVALPDGDQDVVFYDLRARELGKILRENDIESIPLFFPTIVGIVQPPLIHCATNIYDKRHGVTSNFLLEYDYQ